MDEVRVQHKFTRVTDDGVTYTDALYFTREEYDALDEAQLDALEDERFTTYVDNQKVSAEIDVLNQQLAEKLAVIDPAERKKVLAEVVTELDAKVDVVIAERPKPVDEKPVDELPVDEVIEPIKGK